jgi:HTH-type transcriptional regulator / antitoxin HigA
MKLKPIKSKKDYEAYLHWVDSLFDKKVKPNSPEGETLHIALLLIKEYEDKHYPVPVPVPDPIETIKLKMQERGLKNKDLVGKVGTKGYVSAILNKKKPLTLELAKIFHRELGISADVLLS